MLAAGGGWAAVSTNYGSVATTEAMRGIGPVIGCYGTRDRTFRGNAQKLKERLAPLSVSCEVHELNAGHAFLTDGHHPVAKVFVPQMAIGEFPEAREEAWERIFAFFARHL